jgi:predicted dinucleotide-binding enzyme
VAFNSLPADDPKALNAVTQLINEIGLEAVDTGNLSSARFAEGLGILTLHLVYKAGYGSRVCFGISVID